MCRASHMEWYSQDNRVLLAVPCIVTTPNPGSLWTICVMCKCEAVYVCMCVCTMYMCVCVTPYLGCEASISTTPTVEGAPRGGTHCTYPLPASICALLSAHHYVKGGALVLLWCFHSITLHSLFPILIHSLLPILW